MARLVEASLYAPVKQYLEEQNFVVRAEVCQCDVVAMRENELIAVELKPAFGLPVLYQALERLNAVDLVWVAVGVPEGKRARENWDEQSKSAVRLCAMLGVGLMEVRDDNVYVLSEPHAYQPRQQLKKRARITKEFTGRSGDFNIGGTTKQPRITVYRENALLLAKHLLATEQGGASQLKKETGIERAYTILNRNVYGWFVRLGKGKFALHANGERALVQYAEVVSALKPTVLALEKPRKSTKKIIAKHVEQKADQQIAIKSFG